MLLNAAKSKSQRDFIEIAICNLYENFKFLSAKDKKNHLFINHVFMGQVEIAVSRGRKNKHKIAIYLKKEINHKLEAMKKKSGLSRVKLVKAAIYYATHEHLL